MGSCDKHMYSFIRNYHTVFQSGCTILHSYQQCMSDPFSVQICQHVALSLFFTLAILMWYIILAHFGLNLHSLMANNVKHHICPSVIPVHVFCPFSNWTVFLLLSHQDSMVLAQRQKYRSMEQSRKPRDKSINLWTPYL